MVYIPPDGSDSPRLSGVESTASRPPFEESFDRDIGDVANVGLYESETGGMSLMADADCD